jgi:Polyketide cyclase / dehydrase and lipid transport
MATIHLTRETTAAPAAVWQVLTDFGSHGRFMPLTRMRLDAGAPRRGWGFAGLTGVGSLRFSDPMVLTVWSPPHELRLVKTGRLLGGWVQVRVAAHGAGSTVDWLEELVLRPLPAQRLTAGAVRRVGELLYGRAIDAMLALAEQGERGEHAEQGRGSRGSGS